jgi:hypothetical protein
MLMQRTLRGFACGMPTIVARSGSAADAWQRRRRREHGVLARARARTGAGAGERHSASVGECAKKTTSAPGKAAASSAGSVIPRGRCARTGGGGAGKGAGSSKSAESSRGPLAGSTARASAIASRRNQQVCVCLEAGADEEAGADKDGDTEGGEGGERCG